MSRITSRFSDDKIGLKLVTNIKSKIISHAFSAFSLGFIIYLLVGVVNRHFT